MRILALVPLLACGGPAGGGDDEPGTTPDAPRPEHVGFISIQSYDAMNIPGQPLLGGTASAGFFMNAAFCTTIQTMDECSVQQCNFTGTPPQVSAGAITITGAMQPITLAPMANNVYPTFTVMAALFRGGESLTVAAAGAEVPAFSHSLVVPAKATITSPVEPSTFLTVDRSRDFAVAWTGGGGGQLQVALDGPGASQRLVCRFEASAGSGTIPASALALVPAGQGGFSMAATEITEVIAGDWAVEVVGIFNAVWPDDSIVSGPTMAQ
jgi:hypothetical protein